MRPYVVLLPSPFSQLTLEVSRVVLSPASPLRRPAVVIANYVFDSLQTDAFRVSKGVLEQCRVTLGLTRPPAPAAGADAAVPAPPAAAAGEATTAVPVDKLPMDANRLDHITAEFSYTPVTLAGAPTHHPASAAPTSAPASHTGEVASAVAAPASAGTGAAPGGVAVYGEPVLDLLLEAYASHPVLHEKASLLVPLGALRAVQALRGIGAGGLALLVGDKGHTRLDDLAGHRDPHLAKHGSFSFMVNFHALRVAVAAAHGAFAMTSPYADGFKSAAYFFAPQSASGVDGQWRGSS